MRKLNTLILPLTLCIAFSAMAKKAPRLFEIKSGAVSQTLYYNGLIYPLKNVPVISPTAGVIRNKNFIYGQLVNKGKVLMSFESTKVVNQMRDSKISYLKALDSYNQKKDWMQSTEVLNAQEALVRAQRALNLANDAYNENKNLFKLGIVSRDQLTQTMTSSENSQISLAQAKRTLTAARDRGLGDNLISSKLTYQNAKEKYDSLQEQVNAKSIKAPASGIVLEPVGTSGSSGSSHNSSKVSGKLDVGSTVQYQQVLMNIGNLDGLTIRFQVPETSINQIKPGQKASVTSAGFPGITLTGKVEEVAAQAATGGMGGGSTPHFKAIVVVPKLTATESKRIRAGMDAQIAINVYKNSKSIVIPVDAVKRDKNGQSYVMRYNLGTQKTTKQIIKTGKVMTDKVQVLKGLNIGQTVVIPDHDKS